MRNKLAQVGITGMSLVVVGALMFFISSAIFMACYNYCVPKMIHSVDKNYDVDMDFSPIDFWTSCVAVILLGFLVGNVYPINQIYTDNYVQ